MSFRGLLWTLPLVSGFIVGYCAQDAQPAYRNPKLTAKERAADLVKRMTLEEEEKVDRLAGGRRRAPNGNDPEEQQIFQQLGRLYHENPEVSPHDPAQLRNEAPHFLTEKTRLGEPAIFQGEALHGFMAYVGTSFPQVLGLVEHLGYLFDGRNPIYPFGFGLSYTQFRFENVCIEPKTIRTDGNARVSVNITNTGGRAGDERAQLYIRQPVASRTDPSRGCEDSSA
jgi:hypothetical protein